MHHKGTRHFGMLRDGREQWRSVTKLHPRKLMTAKAGQYKDFDQDKHIVVGCVLSNKAPRTLNYFC